MMDSLQLLLWAIVFYVAGGCASLLLRHAERIAIYAAGVSAMIGGILGIAAAWPVVMGGDAVVFATQGLFPFAAFSVRLDGLAAFMVLVISLLVVVCSLYSLSYVQEYRGRGAWGMGFFMNLFIASMVGLVVMDNAFYFIILFEMMSLASWFLVIAEQDDESVSAGLLYFFIAHAGSVKAAVSISPASVPCNSRRGPRLSSSCWRFWASAPKPGCCRCTAGCPALTLPRRLTLRH